MISSCRLNVARFFSFALFIFIIFARASAEKLSNSSPELTKPSNDGTPSSAPETPQGTSGNTSDKPNLISAKVSNDSSPKSPLANKLKCSQKGLLKCLLVDFSIVRLILLYLAPFAFHLLPHLLPHIHAIIEKTFPLFLIVVYPLLVMFLPRTLEILFPPQTRAVWKSKIKDTKVRIKSEPKKFLKEKVENLKPNLGVFVRVILPLYSFVVFDFFIEYLRNQGSFVAKTPRIAGKKILKGKN